MKNIKDVERKILHKGDYKMNYPIPRPKKLDFTGGTIPVTLEFINTSPSMGMYFTTIFKKCQVFHLYYFKHFN